VKLSEKFARQESEAARLARIARRRIYDARAQSVRQLLGLPAEATAPALPAAYVCDVCGRGFALPMHLGRHKSSRHKPPADA
jgi:hypothetical protein